MTKKNGRKQKLTLKKRSIRKLPAGELDRARGGIGLPPPPELTDITGDDCQGTLYCNVDPVTSIKRATVPQGS